MQIKEICKYSPHLNESFKCVLTPEGTGERGLKPWSIFLHSGLHLKDMTVRPISSKKKKTLSKTDATKLLPGRVPIEIMRILMCTNFHRQCTALWLWDENPKQLVVNNNKNNQKFSYCYWSYLSSLFHLLCCWSLIDLMGRKGGHGMGGPTDFEMCMIMDSHLKGENRQKAMAGYICSTRLEPAVVMWHNTSKHQVVILQFK